MGDLVPADCRLVQCSSGHGGGGGGSVGVDQSALTGESVILDRPVGTLLFAASLVKRGEATAVVTATGAATFFGKTARLVDESAPLQHMDKVLQNVVKSLMSVVITMLVVAIIGVAAGAGKISLVEVLPLLLILLVGAMPVALPAMFTTAMALGSNQLVQKGVLVTRYGCRSPGACPPACPSPA
jgi:H+-transporting ATPase